MRSKLLILVLSTALAGCASDRSITGPHGTSGPALLVRAPHVANRCPQSSGIQYVPYYVIDGRVFEPGRATTLARLDPDEITGIDVVRGDEAAARYGSNAGIVGVVIITTRDGSGADMRSNSRR